MQGNKPSGWLQLHPVMSWFLALVSQWKSPVPIKPLVGLINPLTFFFGWSLKDHRLDIPGFFLDSDGLKIVLSEYF